MNQTQDKLYKQKAAIIVSFQVALKGKPRTSTHCLGLLAPTPTCAHVLSLPFLPQLFPASISVLFCLSNGSSCSNSQIGLGIFSPTWYPSILYICLSTLQERNFQSKLPSDFFLKCFLPSIHNKAPNSKQQCQFKVAVVPDIYNAVLHELNKKLFRRCLYWL